MRRLEIAQPGEIHELSFAQLNPGDGSGSGYGDGSGSGYGYGSGYGSGYGDGDGSGDGYGSGSGYGYGSGSGYGYGSGSGSGYGDGSGYGYGSGSGYGYGSGSGSGSGYGYGSGSGSGAFWLFYLNEQKSDDVAFWWSDEHGQPCNGGTVMVAAAIGVTHETSGPLVVCGAGTLHATINPEKWSGSQLWLVRTHGEVVCSDDKIGCLKREIIRKVIG